MMNILQVRRMQLERDRLEYEKFWNGLPVRLRATVAIKSVNVPAGFEQWRRHGRVAA